jgi:hypothetical protein
VRPGSTMSETRQIVILLAVIAGLLMGQQFGTWLAYRHASDSWNPPERVIGPSGPPCTGHGCPGPVGHDGNQ